MGQNQIPANLPDGLYFHARDYEATTPKVENGQSVAHVHGHRRSQAMADVFAKLDRLRGGLKQLRYMDETGHIDQVLPHIRQRASAVFADMDALLADVDEAVARFRGPGPESAPVEQWRAVQDPPDSPSNVRIFDASAVDGFTEAAQAVPSPRDMVAEVNDAALRHQRDELKSRLRWSTQGGPR